MARFRLRRWLLWGLLFLPVLAMPAGFLLARAWVNQQLQRDLTLGKLHLHLSGPRLGWDLNFSADSLRLTSPGFEVRTGRVRAVPRIWQSLVNLSPSVSAVVDTVRIDLPAGKVSRQPRVFRLRSRKPASFPPLRIPIPFRFDAGKVEVARAGRPLAELSGVAVLSQGPKGAALQWERVKAFLPPPDSGKVPVFPAASAAPPVADSILVLEGPFRASARWFGKWVKYQARFQSVNGDAVRLEGERRKSDLGRGRDSLDLSMASLAAYRPLFKSGKAPDYSDLRLSASFGIDKSLLADVRLAMRAPGPLRLGPQQVAVRLTVEDSSGRLVAESKGDEGEALYLQGQFRLPLLDSLDGSGLLAGITGNFSGFTSNVRIPLGRKVLPGDLEIKRLRIAGGEAQAEVRTRDSTELSLRAFRDSTWKLTFTGMASPTETWAHAWTDTNVAYRSAAVSGQFRPGELVVEVRGRQVRAYGAVADSLWARNVVRKRGYYLADSRLYWKDVVWPVKGEVEWTERRAVRGPRVSGPSVSGHTGLKFRREISLSFHATHARHGYLEYAMPRRKSMVVKTENLSVEHLPVPRLEKVLAYRPILTGRFAWDWQERRGEAGVRAAVLYAGRRLGLDLEAGWDSRLLQVPVFEVAFEGSRLRLGADLRLRGRQFHQVRKLAFADVQGLEVEAEGFEASHLSALLPGMGILEGGTLNGKLSYADSTGFLGLYRVDSLRLKPLRNFMEIPVLSIVGSGRDLVVAATTTSLKYPWLNDTLTLKGVDILGGSPGVTLKVSSAGGLKLTFQGEVPDFKSLRGSFASEGSLALPGGAGMIRDFRLTGGLAAPLDKGFVPNLRVDSAVVTGRYAGKGLETQTFRGEVEIRDGRLVVPSLESVDESGRTLSGQAECRLGRPVMLTARLRGQALAFQLQGLQKLLFREVEASVKADSSGVSAHARVGKVSIQTAKGAVAARGDLENVNLTFLKAPSGEGGRESIPQLGLKARLRNTSIHHKIGFRELQRFFRTVKVDKRRKRVKPMDLNISLEAVGGENRIETDILRMYFTGDLAVKGIYPYTLLSGEISALSGEIGQTSQSYNIVDFGLKWQNATMDEGRVYVEGGKKLKVDCKPETRRTCNVFIKLEGRLDEMTFTYDSDCGQTAGGEVIEPAALINSVSRGCYSGDYVSGAGGGGYGEAVFTFLEPTISDNLTRRMSQVSRGWIKTTQVSGIGTMVSRGDTTGISEPISVSVESREKWGVKAMAKAGYHPEKKDVNQWENKVALEWRPPLERVAKGSEWKRRVRDRVTLEASAETRPEERLEEEDRQVRRQVGIRYRYKFWNLW